MRLGKQLMGNGNLFKYAILERGLGWQMTRNRSIYGYTAGGRGRAEGTSQGHRHIEKEKECCWKYK